ncbi:NAC domain-containing protein 83-like [Tasmannia lanceolata]|uniref:NAC domain-containing protein 83-like n=1 Tax=Tasmannia lanceolata TaxID=3420 RepID=UPI0040648E3D
MLFSILELFIYLSKPTWRTSIVTWWSQVRVTETASHKPGVRLRTSSPPHTPQWRELLRGASCSGQRFSPSFLTHAFLGDSKQKRYFFCVREAKYPFGKRPNRATCSGYWKVSGSDKPIVASRGNQVVGMKQVLVFYTGKPPKGTITDWIMHEYRLADEEIRGCIFPQRRNSTQNSMIQIEDWVLCCIFLKKRRAKIDSDSSA